MSRSGPGGSGTPAIAAFAAEEFAVAANLTRQGAMSLFADALDLHHRLPRLWVKVELLEVPGWKARRVAELTRKLSAEAAAWFDTQLALGERYGWPTIERTLAMAVAKFHPELIRDKTGPLSKADWDVTLTHKHGPEGTASGTSTLDVVGDSLDLARFHDLICEEAEKLRRAGDVDTLGQRKAKALGSIAEAQDTLDFGGLDKLDHRKDARADEGLDKLDHREDARADEGLDKLDHRGSVDRACRDHSPASTARRRLRIFVHTTLTDLFGTDDLTIADADKLGPVLVEQLTDWLKRHGSIATITPVIDLNRTCFGGPPRPTRLDGRTGPSTRPALHLPALHPVVHGRGPRPHRALRRRYL
ncbi:hypothetical protein ACLM5J_06065 [Nocardioides sp. Bht2]|uniref:hypothetical protein n=1 Tax=Nocardioides sp. Bht2 TaxID=3392297 RepID=UPI0039B47C2A